MRSWNCKKFCLTTQMKSGLSFKASFWHWKLQNFCLTTMMISRLSSRASFWSWKLQIILTAKTDEIGIVVLFGLEMPEILSAPRAKCWIITLRTGSTNTFTNALQICFHYKANSLQMQNYYNIVCKDKYDCALQYTIIFTLDK